MDMHQILGQIKILHFHSIVQITGSGIQKYQWSPDGVTIYDCSNPYVFTMNTRTGFWVRAVDKVGNFSGWGGGIILAKDSVPPVASLNIGTKTKNSIAVSISASDSLSGLAANETYRYYLNNNFVTSSTTNSFTYNGLTPGTNYVITVEVVDNAGNKTTLTNTTSTEKELWGFIIVGNDGTIDFKNPSSTTNPTILSLGNTNEQRNP